MLKNLLVNKFLVLCLCSSVTAAATNAEKKKIIDSYMKLHYASFKETCKQGVDQTADQLYKNYLGDGLYIPFLLDGNLDVETIKTHIDLFVKKQNWLKLILADLNKKKDFKVEKTKLRLLENNFKKLRRVYHSYYLANDFEKKKEIIKLSKEETLKFRDQILSFIEENNYLHSFQFPVDHFYLRTEYDKVKNLSTAEGKQKINHIYFLRKIVEEGAVDREKGRSDLTFRALVDSVFMRLDSYNETFLDKNLLYDIESLIKMYSDTFDLGVKSLISRSENWLDKTIKDYDYYNKLINEQASRNSVFKKIFDDKNKARYALSDYIYSKEADVYTFWAKQSDLYRKLFAIETILFHEVGRLDDNTGTERRDVIKVVLNREKVTEYGFLEKADPIVEKLELKGFKTYNKYPWLNILFKQGEFSFTYFFIPASRGIFCPDQSKSAKKLRRENLLFALNEIENNDQKFLATRYFSRASMLGRIDMAKLWDEYSAIEERPGPAIVRDRKLQQNLVSGDFIYQYSFTSNKQTYEVLRMKDEDFVYSSKLKKFFKYRNPHHFKYFIKNTPY